MALLVVCGAAVAVAGASHVRLTVSYCPGLFAGLGAVVDVDPAGGGAFDLVSKDWRWPDSGGVGCPENEDPNVFVMGSGAGPVLLDFTTNFGFVVEVDAAGSGNVTRAVAAKTSQLLFDGFTSAAMTDAGLVGLTPQAGPKGEFCSDGCFQFGTEAWPSGEFVAKELVPFKAAMTNIAYLDAASDLFYFQGSYPLNAKATCSADQTQECMAAIDVATGEVVSSVGPNAFTVYSFHQVPVAADGTVLAFVFGFEGECKDGLNDFAFARVDLKAGTATRIACMDKAVNVNTNPNVGSFSPDGKLFATGSGNSETGEVELIVLDTATGARVLDSSLPGLKAALRVSKQAPFINVWGVSWA